MRAAYLGEECSARRRYIASVAAPVCCPAYAVHIEHAANRDGEAVGARAACAHLPQVACAPKMADQRCASVGASPRVLALQVHQQEAGRATHAPLVAGKFAVFAMKHKDKIYDVGAWARSCLSGPLPVRSTHAPVLPIALRGRRGRFHERKRRVRTDTRTLPHRAVSLGKHP